MKNDRLTLTVERLINEGEHVLKAQKSTVEDFTKWMAGCSNLMRMLGEFSEPWKKDLLEAKEAPDHTDGWYRRVMLGVLRAIKESIDNDLLISVEDIVVAETFDNLLQQAVYLLSEGYFLAAGVLGRAVLEEHLRKWCLNAKCFPSKSKPTINDFAISLYKDKQYNVAVLKHIESMAAIGNQAAHNEPGLGQDEVERLIRDLRDFLGKYSAT